MLKQSQFQPVPGGHRMFAEIKMMSPFCNRNFLSTRAAVERSVCFLLKVGLKMRILDFVSQDNKGLERFVSLKLPVAGSCCQIHAHGKLQKGFQAQIESPTILLFEALRKRGGTDLWPRQPVSLNRRLYKIAATLVDALIFFLCNFT